MFSVWSNSNTMITPIFYILNCHLLSISIAFRNHFLVWYEFIFHYTIPIIVLFKPVIVQIWKLLMMIMTSGQSICWDCEFSQWSMRVSFTFFHWYDEFSSQGKYYIPQIAWPQLIVAQSGCYIEDITSADFIGCYYLNIGAVDFTTYRPVCIVVWLGPSITCAINWAFGSQRISWTFCSN